MPDQAGRMPDSARGKSIPQLKAAEDTQLARALSCLDDAAGNGIGPERLPCGPM